MTVPLVLDAAGLDALAERDPPDALRALLAEALRRDRDVLVPAVVCAELCRGASRTRRIESALARHDRSRSERPPVRVEATDFALARLVGAVLHGARAGSEALADAHVVAVCARHGGGLVVTADAHDVLELAAAVPAARIVTRAPRG